MTAAWSSEALDAIGSAEELQLASRRSDGSLRPFVTMWVVRVGDDLFVRSAGGPDRPWFRRALASGSGHIRAGGVETDVAFGTDIDSSTNDAIDATYHAKYDRYGPRIVGSVVGADTDAVSIRLIPEEQP